MRTLVVMTGCILGLAGICSGFEYMANPPVIDGKVLSEEWKDARHVVHPPKHHSPMDLYFGADKTHIYFGAVFRVEDMSKLKMSVRDRDGYGIWGDACVELFLDTNRDRKTYYHFIINPLGALYDGYIRDVGWNCEGVRSAAFRGKTFWSCELAIPLASLNRMPIRSQWGFAVCERGASGYNFYGGRPHRPADWSSLRIPPETVRPFLKAEVKNRLVRLRKTMKILTHQVGENKTDETARVHYLLAKSRFSSVGRNFRKAMDSGQIALLEQVYDEMVRCEDKIDQTQQLIQRIRAFENISPSGKLAAYVASPMAKIRKNSPLPKKPITKAKIRAAKGESESFQIVLMSSDQPLSTLHIRIANLKHENGKEIITSAENIHIYKVMYLYAAMTCSPEFPPGWYPDPLIKTWVVDMGRYDVQPMWITVDVPRDAKPGIYRGDVIVSAPQMETIKIPIELRVWNFSLPITPALKTSFSVWGKTFARQTGIDRKSPYLEKLIYDDYWHEALRHRITLRNIPTYGPKFNTFVPEILKKGATCIALRRGPLLACKPEDKKDIQEHLRKKGWLDKSFIRIWDEPSEKDYPKVAERAKKIKQYAPDIKISNTSRFNPVTDPYVDIWVPRFSWYNENQDTYKTAVENGDEVWLYTCDYPQRPYPNFHLELPGIEPRMCIWACWRYNVTGFLYYSTNYWKVKDIWKNVRSSPAANLDGVLFYPAQDGKPILSQRLEVLRDGIDDFDYLTLLRKLTGKLQQLPDNSEKNKLLKQAHNLLDVSDVMKNFEEWTKDPKVLQTHRDRCGELLDQLVPLLKNPSR